MAVGRYKSKNIEIWKNKIIQVLLRTREILNIAPNSRINI